MSPGEAMSVRRSFGMIWSCREIRGSQAEGNQSEIRGNQEIIEVVEELKGEQWESFRERHGDWGRDLVLTLARQNCGMKLRELGKMAGGIGHVSVSVAERRLQQRLKEDRNLAGLYQKAQTRLNNDLMCCV
jgi:chromosomal replication initiation ATPase DnaA